jgi:hypothetical protein
LVVSLSAGSEAFPLLTQDSGGCVLGSAAWADVDQTIKPRIILLNPLGQNVLLGVALVSANSVVLAWLPMANDSLDVAMFLRLGSLHNSRRG